MCKHGQPALIAPSAASLLPGWPFAPYMCYQPGQPALNARHARRSSSLTSWQELPPAGTALFDRGENGARFILPAL
jgi:hypothetical protein